MKINDAGLDIIKTFEGCELKAYKDTGGVLTIGFGHTTMAGPPTVKAGMTITRDEAEEILRRDIALFERGVESLLKVQTSSNQFSALVSMAFNVGLEALKTSTLLRYHNAADPIGAADQFAKWVYDNKVKLPGLVRRRNAERMLYSTPDAPKVVSQPEPVPVNPDATSGKTAPIPSMSSNAMIIVGVAIIVAVAVALWVLM